MLASPGGGPESGHANMPRRHWYHPLTPIDRMPSDTVLREQILSFLKAHAKREYRAKVLAQEAWEPLRMGRAVATDTPEHSALLHPDVRKAFDGPYEAFNDLADPAIALCYRRRAPLETMTKSFDRWSRLLWGPVLSALEDA